jgi:alpha-glucosidase
MQWSRGHAAGFTSGAAWEPLQLDSLRANVAVEEADPNSLLHRYRQLIHLRASNAALGRGALVPIEATNPAVAAYLRRDGANVVLVIANLGKTPLSGVAVSSGERAIPQARYAVNDLLAGGDAARLDVEADGRLRGYTPLATLEPQRTYVLELRASSR